MAGPNKRQESRGLNATQAVKTAAAPSGDPPDPPQPCRREHPEWLQRREKITRPPRASLQSLCHRRSASCRQPQGPHPPSVWSVHTSALNLLTHVARLLSARFTHPLQYLPKYAFHVHSLVKVQLMLPDSRYLCTPSSLALIMAGKDCFSFIVQGNAIYSCTDDRKHLQP